jgi:hypothetical protein
MTQAYEAHASLRTGAQLHVVQLSATSSTFDSVVDHTEAPLEPWQAQASLGGTAAAPAVGVGSLCRVMPSSASALTLVMCCAVPT